MGRSRRRFDSRAEWARKGVSKQLHVFALKRDGFLFGRTSSSRLGPTEMHQDPLTSPRIRVSRRFFLSREILDGKVNLSIVERGCHCCCVNNNKVFILDRVEFRDLSSRHFTGIRFLCLKFISSIRSIKKHDEKGMDFNMDGEDDSRCKSRYNREICATNISEWINKSR